MNLGDKLRISTRCRSKVTDVAESEGNAIVFILFTGILPNSKTLPTSPLLEMAKSGIKTNSLEFLA
jgi:hypothetical protein